MPMTLAFSTNAFTKFPLDEACRRIAGHGYRAVEILADVPHMWPATFSDHQADALRKLLGDLGLSISNINANTMFGHWTDAPPEPFFEPSLVSDVAEYRTLRVETLLRTLDLAARLGARTVSITTGKPLGSMSPEACEPVLEENLGRVLERADSLGIDVGIECEPGLLLEWTDELVAWIQRMNSPRLGANLDLGHAQVIGEVPAESIRKLRGRIWNLHIEDIRGRKHYHRIPGEGDMDFPAIAAALREVNYDRCVTVELYTYSTAPDRAAKESYEALAPLFVSRRW